MIFSSITSISGFTEPKVKTSSNNLIALEDNKELTIDQNEANTQTMTSLLDEIATAPSNPSLDLTTEPLVSKDDQTYGEDELDLMDTTLTNELTNETASALLLGSSATSQQSVEQPSLVLKSPPAEVRSTAGTFGTELAKLVADELNLEAGNVDPSDDDDDDDDDEYCVNSKRLKIDESDLLLSAPMSGPTVAHSEAIAETGPSGGSLGGKVASPSVKDASEPKVDSSSVQEQTAVSNL